MINGVKGFRYVYKNTNCAFLIFNSGRNFFNSQWLFKLRKEGSNTPKIPEGGKTFRWLYMQKFGSVWLTVEKELKINEYPLNGPPLLLFCLSLVLGSS